MPDDIPQLVKVDLQSFKDLIQAFGVIYKLTLWLMENDPDTADKLASPVGNIRTLILAISEANDLINDDGIERINKPLYDTIAYMLKVGPPKG